MRPENTSGIIPSRRRRNRILLTASELISGTVTFCTKLLAIERKGVQKPIYSKNVAGGCWPPPWKDPGPVVPEVDNAGRRFLRKAAAIHEMLDTIQMALA